jgi:Tfp pilus assembly protein PilZ
LGRRKSKRVPFRNTIRFGPHIHPDHTSYITDLSDNGVCLKTNKVFDPGTKLYMLIDTHEKSYKAEGVVVWERRVAPKSVQIVKVGMGIKFTHVDHELVDLYHDLLKNMLVEHGRVEIH